MREIRDAQIGDVFGPFSNLGFYPGQVIRTNCGKEFVVQSDGTVRCTASSLSTLYDRGARTGSEPIGASGVFARRDGGREHNTQYYEDGYRLSRDTGPNGDHKVHWTNQNVSRGAKSRHYPPGDAR